MMRGWRARHSVFRNRRPRCHSRRAAAKSSEYAEIAIAGGPPPPTHRGAPAPTADYGSGFESAQLYFSSGSSDYCSSANGVIAGDRTSEAASTDDIIGLLPPTAHLFTSTTPYDHTAKGAER
jgi:hypothetical protein